MKTKNPKAKLARNPGVGSNRMVRCIHCDGQKTEPTSQHSCPCWICDGKGKITEQKKAELILFAETPSAAA
jgi:DnaJ-class molecular chaperone